MTPLEMASVFQPFQDVLNELGRDLVARPLGMASGMAGQMISRIRLDLDEDETAYTVRAEIPGARKEDIHVSVEGSAVSLSAEVREETHAAAGQRTLYRERSYGRLSRAFSLPQEVDSHAAIAQYRDGVLTLVLPKKASLSGKRVPIS
ncbi:MAG TPA: Hsp20/alpha crystallin family protein [Burkholderiales bacterium]